MKKYHSLDDDSDEIEFSLYALKAVNISDYLFVYTINQTLKFQFQRIEDLEIYRKNLKLSYNQYFYFDPIKQIEYTLILNLSNPSMGEISSSTLFENDFVQEYLIKNYKEFNFILKSNMALSKEFLLHLSAELQLLACQEIDLQEVTQIQKFIA